jgi:hypothetical protein
MPGEIAYKLTAEESQALQAVSRLTKEFGLNETAIKKAVKASEELDQTQQRMGRDAARIFEETRTPMEHQAMRLEKLSQLHQANKIDADTYARAVRQVEGQHDKTFGAQAMASLEKFATGFNPLITAANALKGVLAEIEQMRAAGAAKDRSAEMAEGSLAEVAGGDPQKFQELLAKSRGISTQAGMSREQAAALTFAAASAGALGDVGTFADLHAQGIVSDPEQLMRATKTLQTAMGRQQTGSLRDITSKLLAAGEYSPQKIAQLGPATALAGVNAQDADVNTSELLAAVAIESTATGDASIAATMQKSLQKSLAALRSSRPGKAGEAAIETDEEGHILDQKAQKLRDDARQVLAKAGPGLMGQLHAIRGMGLDAGQMQKLFGRQEGLMAYNILLRNEAQFEEARAGIGIAPSRDLVGKVLGLTRADARQLAAGEARRSETAVEAAQSEAFGADYNITEAVLGNVRAKSIQEGHWLRAAVDRWNPRRAVSAWRQHEAMMDVQAMYNLSPEQELSAVRGFGGGNLRAGEERIWGREGERNPISQEMFESYKEATKTLREAAKDLKDSGGNLRLSAQARPTLVPPNIDK